MNYTVSFTDFRKNISNYADMVNAGKSVTVNDEKKGIPLFKIVRADEDNFDWDKYMSWMENFTPFLTDSDVKSMSKFRNDINKRLALASKR
ncbi:MAG: hypothetical protein ACD_19C00182G0082 [uncultured bacterium]|nr:MAG: hypothetical protein ACD_19C00182G0082 [uncultured bacterium]